MSSSVLKSISRLLCLKVYVVVFKSVIDCTDYFVSTQSNLENVVFLLCFKRRSIYEFWLDWADQSIIKTCLEWSQDSIILEQNMF